jgi:hypothetical protein
MNTTRRRSFPISTHPSARAGGRLSGLRLPALGLGLACASMACSGAPEGTPESTASSATRAMTPTPTSANRPLLSEAMPARLPGGPVKHWLPPTYRGALDVVPLADASERGRTAVPENGPHAGGCPGPDGCPPFNQTSFNLQWTGGQASDPCFWGFRGWSCNEAVGGANPFMVAQVSENGTDSSGDSGNAAVGFTFDDTYSDSDEIVSLTPNLDFTFYVFVDANNLFTQVFGEGTITLYVVDTTSGSVVLNDLSTAFFAESSGFSSASSGDVNGFQRYVLNTPLSSSFRPAPGHSYAIWVWANTATDYWGTNNGGVGLGSGPGIPVVMEVNLHSLTYSWFP